MLEGRYKYFGRWLQDAIEAQDLNHHRAGMLTDVSANSIGDYVKGRRIPSLESLYLICMGLDLSLSLAINECIKDIAEDLK